MCNKKTKHEETKADKKCQRESSIKIQFDDKDVDFEQDYVEKLVV